MRLWTYHPPEFLVTDQQPIDPTLGRYWRDPTLCYEEALPRLCRMIDAEQFPLWCFTTPDCWQLEDPTSGPIEWELEVPEPAVLAFIHALVWDAILNCKSDNWPGAIVSERPVKPDRYISAVVQFPLSPECKVTCCGRVVLPHWREEAEFLKNKGRALQQRFLQRYRDLAADPQSDPAARRLDAVRVEYLQEVLELNLSAHTGGQ